MDWKKRTQVVQTAAAPPRYGSNILPTIGWQTKSRNALRNSVAAKIPKLPLLAQEAAGTQKAQEAQIFGLSVPFVLFVFAPLLMKPADENRFAQNVSVNCLHHGGARIGG